MTNEEAIAVLEESKRQNEIMRDNPTTFWKISDMEAGIENAKKRILALDAAISAIRHVSAGQPLTQVVQAPELAGAALRAGGTDTNVPTMPAGQPLTLEQLRGMDQRACKGELE